MAISSQTTTVSYTGNASTVTPYPVTFRYDEAAWVTVQEIDLDGAVTTLALGSDYTLTGNGSTTTGNVVTGGGAIPATSTLRIVRDTALTQTVSLSVNGTIPSAVIEAELDKLTMSHLDQKRRQAAGDARSLRVPDGETAAELPAAANRKGEIPYFNATTGAVETKTPDEILALTDSEIASDITAAQTAATSASASATSAAASATSAAALLHASLSVLAYGAAGDAAITSVAAMTSGSGVLTATGAGFVAGNVGKWIRVEGAGTAGADLVTTIASYQSTTQVTLTAPASTTVSAKFAVWGTNDTTAIQSAIDAAAASAVTRTVYFPPGRYICNVTAGDGIAFLGTGWEDTWLHPATRAEPVIAFSTCYGSSVRHLGFANGTTSRTGIGVEVGAVEAAATGYTGNSFTIEFCLFSGFDYCISQSRTASTTIANVSVAYANFGFFFAESGAADGITDNVICTACTSLYCDVVFRVFACKNVTVNGGDFNYPVTFANITDNGTLTGTGFNIEEAASPVHVSVFDLDTGGNVVVQSVQFLAVAAPGLIVRRKSSDAGICDIRRSNSTIYYRTGGSEYPQFIGLGYVARYSDYTLATRQSLEPMSPVMRADGLDDRANLVRFAEWWRRARGASPYGEQGWTITNISGTHLLRGSVASAENVEFYSSTTDATNAARLTLEAAVLWLPNFWELSIIMSVPAPTNAIFRAGLYSRDGTADMTPTYGIGIKVDRSVPDANIMLEFRNNATVTEVSTGVAVGSLSSTLEFLLQRTTTGYAVLVRNYATRAIQAAQVHLACTPPSQYCAPGIYSAVAALGYAQLNLFGCRARQLPAETFAWSAP